MTTAKGIETSDSVDWLSGQGCDFGQGYLFAAPMPRDAMDRLISAQPDEQSLGVPTAEAA